MESLKDYHQDTANFYAIAPKEDCPHQNGLNWEEISYNITKEKLIAPCKDCNTTQENWLCLLCYNVFCSRYANSHMVEHNDKTGHHIALSFTDGSFWCYQCDSYVHSRELRGLALKFSTIKFPETEGRNIQVTDIAKEMAGNIPQPEEKEVSKKFSRQELVKGLNDDTFKRVIFITGAGISVAAGIPDFRSDTGLYAQLGDCDLPRPEAIFEISYFKEKPETFYKLAKTILNFKAKPTVAHYFMKMMADKGKLLIDFTQNVDGLEVEAGLDPKYLIEAHGHTRSAHCSKCNKSQDVEKLKQCINDGTVMSCECGGPVKPDIIFFGEALPVHFFESIQNIAKGDLVFVMGTSLQVFPFAMLVQMIPDEIPIVLVNRENTKIHREKFLFLEGDIDSLLKQLIEDLGWDKQLDQLRGNL